MKRLLLFLALGSCSKGHEKYQCIAIVDIPSEKKVVVGEKCYGAGSGVYVFEQEGASCLAGKIYAIKGVTKDIPNIDIFHLPSCQRVSTSILTDK
jgi:gamma-glutamylcyclotransferase (GGCT)/AIG2-like uncharacterized protein YtfP